MKYYFVINPNAGKEKVNIEDEIKEVYKNLDYTIYYTKCEKDAIRYVKETCEANSKEQLRFFACGGDGTISEVASGLLGFENASLVPYPCGSGNDFVRHFNINFKDIKQFIDKEAKPIDLLKIDDKYYSINVTNIGFDADVNAGVIELKKKIKAEKAYTKSLIKCLLKKFSSDYEITFDDNETISGKYILMSIANASYYGGGYNCAPNAIVDDGLIDFTIVKKVSRLTFVRLVSKYKAGTFFNIKKFDKVFYYKKCKKVTISSKKNMSIAYDGEMLFQDKVTIELLPKAIKVAY